MDKECLVCGSIFQLYERYSQKKYCSNSCGNTARGRSWRKNNPDKVREKNIRERWDWAKRSCTLIKSRAKKSGIPFNIDHTDLILPEVCPVLGIKIERKIEEGSGYWDCNPSVDRIDPKKGYIKGNVRVISHRANLLKSNASIEELELVLKDLKRINNV